MMWSKLRAWHSRLVGVLEAGSPVGDLLIRLWVANAFWQAGLVKIASMYSTVYMFRTVYHVPLLPPAFAAYLGTGIELVFPVLLAFGIATRFAAGFLFIYNIVAVISYPALWATGFTDHKVWGLMLLMTALHGPGALSVDAMAQRWGPRLLRALKGARG